MPCPPDPEELELNRLIFELGRAKQRLERYARELADLERALTGWGEDAPGVAEARRALEDLKPTSAAPPTREPDEDPMDHTRREARWRAEQVKAWERALCGARTALFIHRPEAASEAPDKNEQPALARERRRHLEHRREDLQAARRALRKRIAAEQRRAEEWERDATRLERVLQSPDRELAVANRLGHRDSCLARAAELEAHEQTWMAADEASLLTNPALFDAPAPEGR